MSNISQWSGSAASNNSAPPDGAPEGQAPSTVNDTMREIMAAVARQYLDSDGSLTTGGSSNSYTLTTNNSHAALADIGLLVFRADRANTGTATLNVDSLGAKNLKMNGDNLGANWLVADQMYAAVYNSTNDVFDILGALSGNPSELYQAGNLRVRAGTSGHTNIYSDGSTDSENRALRLMHSDQTVRSRIGQIGDDVLHVRSDIDSGHVAIEGTNSGSATRTLVNGDPDAGTDIYYAGGNTINIKTVDESASDAASGGQVRGPDNNFWYIGYNTIPGVTISGGGGTTLAQSHIGKSFHYNSGTADSLVLNNDATIPNNSAWGLRVGPSAGTLTIDGGTGVTLKYWNGSGYSTTSSGGNLTAGQGLYLIWKELDTSYYIDGPSLVAV